MKNLYNNLFVFISFPFKQAIHSLRFYSILLAVSSGVLVANAQVYTEHVKPIAGQNYDSSILGTCIGCSISDASFVADTAKSNFTSLYITAGVMNGGILRAKLSQSAGIGFAGFILENNQTGLLSPTVLSNIVLRTYNNGSLVDTATGSSDLNLSSLSGNLQFIEMQTAGSFDEVEIEFNGFVGALWDLSIYRGYANGTTLPVELIQFDGIINDGLVELNWSTASEINNSHFVIMRSTDGIKFEAVGQVLGEGNSSQIASYTFQEPVIGREDMFYKLNQVDYDGTSTFSNTIFLERAQVFDINIFPNPTSNGTVHVISEEEALHHIDVLTSDGRVVSSYTMSDKRELVLQQLPKGTYLIVTHLNNGVSTTTRLIAL